MYRVGKQNLLGIVAVVTVTLLLSGLSILASAQDEHTPGATTEAAPYQAPPAGAIRPQGTVIKPQSSIERPGDAGKFAHTNYSIFVPAGRNMATISPDNTFAEYPASLACVYKVGPPYAGCTPANNHKNASGGWGAIALVDAYDDPTAAADLKFFSTYFGLPAASFIKVIANSSWGPQGSLGLTASCSGTPANANGPGWDVEEALDIEWAHAMAPKAKIILVEACTNSYNDLFVAEEVASNYVNSYGGGEVSNSWGSGEFSGENNYDNYFYRDYWKHITRFASAGDSGWGAAYPSSSPWVVSAGGTTVNRDASGNFLSESCWAGSGGGVSSQETWNNNIFNGMGPWSAYQFPFAGQTARQTPDMSFDADPASGVWVYNTDSGGGWYVVGGTSVSSPALAGLVNAAGNKLGQAPAGGGFYGATENNLLYAQLFTSSDYFKNFYDVTTGSNGVSAGTGYDQCTGVGSPRGKLGK